MDQSQLSFAAMPAVERKEQDPLLIARTGSSTGSPFQPIDGSRSIHAAKAALSGSGAGQICAHPLLASATVASRLCTRRDHYIVDPANSHGVAGSESPFLLRHASVHVLESGIEATMHDIEQVRHDTATKLISNLGSEKSRIRKCDDLKKFIASR